MFYCKGKPFFTIKSIYSLFIGVFVLFFMLHSPLYAGYSIFKFKFTNNTNYMVTIKRGTDKPNDHNNHANPPALAYDTIAPGQTSKIFTVRQQNGKINSVLAMYYKWFASGYKDNHMFCSSVVIFQLTNLGSNKWRYGVFIRQNKTTHPIHPLCKGFKGEGATMPYDQRDPGAWTDGSKWGHKKLPYPENKGHPKHYLINIPLG